MYGTVPCSRWAHLIVPNRQNYPDGIMVFGGVNLNSYCPTKVSTFTLVNQTSKPIEFVDTSKMSAIKPKKFEEQIEYGGESHKLQLLHNNVKDKID